MAPSETHSPRRARAARDAGDDNTPTTVDLDTMIAEATAWADADIDAGTRAEARALIERASRGDDGAAHELAASFGGRLAFGTAGLRGRIGAGPMRMNRVVVSQTTAGFAAYLWEEAKRRASRDAPSVVIGYDGRIGSAMFARDAAEVMSGAGISTYLLPEAGPTPLTAFAVRHLDVSAGIMITASHNPPRDNGYKVYLGDDDAGSQIAPPTDAAIAAHIERVAATPVAQIPRAHGYSVLGSGVADAYVSETSAAVLAGLPERPDAPGVSVGADTDIRVVYTAMHGVGAEIAQRVFRSSGLPRVTPVREQLMPDGNFPTVDFPNPEEPGALDLAYRTARAVDADLIVAHDPDADRLALAAPHPAEASGYRRLTGNELGLLLGWRAAERAVAHAQLRQVAVSGALACTIVSSPALRAVADAYGFEYAETLSGFKWVSRVPGLIFGFEEALGYLIHPAVVRDKDGISASADAVAMVRELASQGRTIWDRLDQASERFGHFASGQVTLRLPSMPAAAALSARVRQDPPRKLGASPVVEARDLLVPGAAEVPADVLRYDLANGSRVMIRPSGTEPKLKVYLDTFSDTGSSVERRAAAEQSLSDLERSVREYLEGLQTEARSA